LKRILSINQLILTILLVSAVSVAAAKSPIPLLGVDRNAPVTTKTGISLVYNASINDPSKHTIHIKLRIGDLNTQVLGLRFSEFWRSDALFKSLFDETHLNFAVTDDTGNKVESKETGKYAWQLTASGRSGLIVSYDVKVSLFHGERYESYIGSYFGMSYGSYIFCYPDGSQISSIRVTFLLPNGWISVAPWKRDATHYLVESVDHLLNSFVGFGCLDVVTREIMGTRIVIATYSSLANYPIKQEILTLSRQVQEQIIGAWKPDVPLGQIVSHSLSCFQYFLEVFGEFPEENLLVLILPPPISEGASRRNSFFLSTDVFARQRYQWVLPHEMFHMWNGNFIKMKTDNEKWFQEGFTQYYGYKALLRVGWWTKKEFDDELDSLWNTYRKEFVGTRFDVAITEGMKRYQETNDLYHFHHFICSRKSAMVAHLLDLTIINATQGKKSLDNVMRYVYERFGKTGARYGTEDIPKATNNAVGIDLTDFFRQYVFGSKELPRPVPESLSEVSTIRTNRYEYAPISLLAPSAVVAVLVVAVLGFYLIRRSARAKQAHKQRQSIKSETSVHIT